jgi:hypothetical protein
MSVAEPLCCANNSLASIAAPAAIMSIPHDLQQYLHTLSPTRDQALVNKSDDTLLPSYCVPNSWWSPVPNRGMVHDTLGGRGLWMRKEALEELKKETGKQA